MLLCLVLPILMTLLCRHCRIVIFVLFAYSFRVLTQRGRRAKGSFPNADFLLADAATVRYQYERYGRIFLGCYMLII